MTCASIGLASVSVFVGVCLGIWVSNAQPSSARIDHVVALADVVKRLDDLNERVTQLAASRCMTVNTPVLNVSVYDAGNVGTAKMPKEKKP